MALRVLPLGVRLNHASVASGTNLSVGTAEKALKPAEMLAAEGIKRMILIH
jgi:hypothetical protein